MSKKQKIGYCIIVLIIFVLSIALTIHRTNNNHVHQITYTEQMSNHNIQNLWKSISKTINTNSNNSNLTNYFTSSKNPTYQSLKQWIKSNQTKHNRITNVYAYDFQNNRSKNPTSVFYKVRFTSNHQAQTSDWSENISSNHKVNEISSKQVPVHE